MPSSADCSGGLDVVHQMDQTSWQKAVLERSSPQKSFAWEKGMTDLNPASDAMGAQHSVSDDLGCSSWSEVRQLIGLICRNHHSFGVSTPLTTLRCLLRTSNPDHSLLPVLTGRKTDLNFASQSRIRVTGRGRLHLGVGQIACASVRDHTILDIRERGLLEIEGRVRIVHGARLYVGKDSTLKIGGGTYIGANSRVLVRSNVSIGSDCAISWNVTIMDTDFHEILDEIGEPRSVKAPVSIGNHVWIGAEAMILKGVHIADNAIIAARSVVVSDVPENVVVAGHPAKVIRHHAGWR